MKLGTDFSQWGGPLASATIECWKFHGTKYAIVQYSSLMNQHISALQAARDVDIEAYVYLYWGTDPWGQSPQVRTLNAINTAAGRIKRLWLDAEDSTHPFRPDQLQECVEICNQMGIPTGIYTGRWWWTSHGGNNPNFSHLPLWDARYLAESPMPDLSKIPTSMAGFVPYGGWNKPTIWQFHNTTSFCGHSVDLNVSEDSEPIEEDEMFVPHDANAQFFENKTIGVTPPGEYFEMQSRLDFGYPTDAKRARFFVRSKKGFIRFFHGKTDIPAGEIGWKGGKSEGVIEAEINDEGVIRFRVERAITTEKIFSLGYFK